MQPIEPLCKSVYLFACLYVCLQLAKKIMTEWWFIYICIYYGGPKNVEFAAMDSLSLLFLNFTTRCGVRLLQTDIS